jgi:hypothetical protein
VPHKVVDGWNARDVPDAADSQLGHDQDRGEPVAGRLDAWYRVYPALRSQAW